MNCSVVKCSAPMAFNSVVKIEYHALPSHATPRNLSFFFVSDNFPLFIPCPEFFPPQPTSPSTKNPLHRGTVEPLTVAVLNQ